MIKKLKLLLTTLMVSVSTMAVEQYYSFEFDNPHFDVPFVAIRISAFSDAGYSPLSDDKSWYNGFSEARGYTTYIPNKGPFQYDETYDYYTGSISMDVAMMGYDSDGNAYNFVAELLAEDGHVLGYSDYTDYSTIQMSADNYGEGGWPWSIGSFSAAPVPEPTSGVLLLIGGALLGLRRKRRV